VPTIALVPTSGGDVLGEVAGAERLWWIAAAVMAPPVSAWALGRHGGAALSADAIKLSARQLLDIPLPVDGSAWARGAACVRQASRAADEVSWHAALVAAGAAMTAAHGLDGQAASEVLDWWRIRLPTWTRARRGAVVPRAATHPP
jgi:hypothetical protein